MTPHRRPAEYLLLLRIFRRRPLDSSSAPPLPLPASSLRRLCYMATGASAVVEDPGMAYKLLLSCPAGLPRSRVLVKFDPSFDRIPHPDASLEASIDEIWNQRLQKNPSLYSGTKFRIYDSVCCQHLSNPLGNGAIVETSDEKIIVLQRSNNVGESPGCYVFPGGHSEPQEVGILAHQNDVQDVVHLIERVSDEMFDGIIREVVEETGVPASSLSEPIFIGVSRRETNVRPAAFFYVRCNVDSSTVTELYSRAQDGYESTKLYAVSIEELREMSQGLPGCHQGGFALYELMRNASGNL